MAYTAVQESCLTSGTAASRGSGVTRETWSLGQTVFLGVSCLPRQCFLCSGSMAASSLRLIS